MLDDEQCVEVVLHFARRNGFRAVELTYPDGSTRLVLDRGPVKPDEAALSLGSGDAWSAKVGFEHAAAVRVRF